MLKKIIVFPFFFLTVMLFLCNCYVTDSDTVSSERFCFGTMCRITIYGKCEKADEIFNAVWERMTGLENNISCKLENSTVSRYNAGEDVTPDEDTLFLLQTALEFTEQTCGLFSPVLCAVSDLWGIGTEHARVPSDEEIKEAFKEKKLDFGALGKGYASDLAREILKEYGVKSAIINFGGNICCVGSKPDGKPFTIGLQEPDSERGIYGRTVEVKDMCVVTSGDYERYFEKDGVRYCHILNGMTGYPVDNGTRAVTVIGEKGLVCDALSTCCFILGEENSRSFLEHYPDYKVVFYNRDYGSDEN